MTIHVLGAADRLEHLRFDCFEHEPHYHYIRNAEQANVVVRIDTFAEGDPTAWSLRCLRERLPEMLAHADATELAEQVRAAGRSSPRASTGSPRWSVVRREPGRDRHRRGQRHGSRHRRPAA